MEIWVGIDWGSEAHEVCGVDTAGDVLFRWRIRHEGEELRKLARRLAEAATTTEKVKVAIETKRGAMVDTLLAHNIRVFHINPKQLDRFRDRFSAGAKGESAKGVTSSCSAFSQIGVAIEPGATMMTSMPSSISSRRKLSESPSSANFDAE